jgi:medium-chain acyl-[acyl-carrier-protein] hydrolase
MECNNSWLGCYRPNPSASIRLFCFSYAGSGAAVFRSWAENLPAGIEVCPIQYSGRNHRLREPLYTNISSLISVLGEELLPMMEKPFAFFGHSMGGKICFELARYLRRNRRRAPIHLIVSGCRAPQLPNEEPNTYDLPHPQFIEELKQLNGTPPEFFEHPELLEMMIPVLRADFELVQTYAYQAEAPLNIPITAFGGAEDVDVTRDHLDKWAEQTDSAFSLEIFPGDHFFINSKRHLLLDAIGRRPRKKYRA